MLALVTLLQNFKYPAPKQAHLRNQLLNFLAFAPLVLNFIISLITGHKALDMWGMPYLSFIPLWFVVNAPLDYSLKSLKAFAVAWGFVFFIALGAFYFSVEMAPSYGFKPIRGHFPGKQLSQTMHEHWSKVTPEPLTYVISDAWIGGNIALYAPDITKRPHVFLDGNQTISPWIDSDDVAAKGALVIWPSHLTKPALLDKMNVKIETITPAWQTNTNAPPPSLNWAIIAPK